MATDRNTVSAWFIILLFSVTVLLDPACSLRKRAPVRSKRQSVCADGNYTYEGRTCCMCGVGQRLVTHCTNAGPTDTKCELCGDDTYSSHPNHKETCEPCTSCIHINANLEVAEKCTSGRDTKCRCAKNYYCSSDIEVCIACLPCTKCGSGGVKTECNATSDTVCYEADLNKAKIITPIVIVIIVIAAVASYVFWRKRRQNNEPQPEETEDPLLPRLRGVDPEPLLPDLAEALGWKTMRNVALRTGMKDTAIEGCKLNHPGDVQEQAQELLRKWVETQGRVAAEKLITTLHQSRERQKEERVRQIFSDRLYDRV